MMSPLDVTLTLFNQALFLGLIGCVCSWIAFVWTHESIFEDIQGVFEAGVKKHKPLMSLCYQEKRWKPMVYHWAIQKACTGLSCHTCCGHYPALVFVSTRGYKFLDTGWAGFVMAWFFTAFVADQVSSTIQKFRINRDKDKEVKEAIAKGNRNHKAPYIDVESERQMETSSFL